MLLGLYRLGTKVGNSNPKLLETALASRNGCATDASPMGGVGMKRLLTLDLCWPGGGCYPKEISYSKDKPRLYRQRLRSSRRGAPVRLDNPVDLVPHTGTTGDKARKEGVRPVKTRFGFVRQADASSGLVDERHTRGHVPLVLRTESPSGGRKACRNQCEFVGHRSDRTNAETFSLKALP